MICKWDVWWPSRMFSGQVAIVLECGHKRSQVLALLANRDFSFFSRYTRPYPKIEKKGFTFVCFGGNIEPSARGSGLCSCLLQSRVSHHCGKPLRCNENASSCLQAESFTEWMKHTRSPYKNSFWAYPGWMPYLLWLPSGKYDMVT